MLQVYLVRHGETQWNAERRIQGQSDSPLTAKGEQQAMQVGERARSLGITHIISSDLGRTKRTAEIIAQACGCDITFDSRLRELDMGVLEKRQIDSLTEEEEGWRRRTGQRHAGWPHSRWGIDAGVERSRSCRAGVLSGATAGQPTFIGQSRYRVGLSGQYYTGTTRLGGTPVTFAQLLYFPHRLPGKSVAGVWVGGRNRRGRFASGRPCIG